MFVLRFGDKGLSFWSRGRTLISSRHHQQQFCKHLKCLHVDAIKIAHGGDEAEWHRRIEIVARMRMAPREPASAVPLAFEGDFQGESGAPPLRWKHSHARHGIFSCQFAGAWCCSIGWCTSPFHEKLMQNSSPHCWR